MTLTISLPIEVQEKLEKRAKAVKWSVEEMATHLLNEALSVTPKPGQDELTPEDVIARILASPAKPQNVRPAVGSLSEALREGRTDYTFDLDEWTKEWAIVEAEMKAIEQADMLADEIE
ncbi:MAG: hypothetical protein WAU10_07500 [Caldilineaceae bacterium]